MKAILLFSILSLVLMAGSCGRGAKQEPDGQEKEESLIDYGSGPYWFLKYPTLFVNPEEMEKAWGGIPVESIEFSRGSMSNSHLPVPKYSVVLTRENASFGGYMNERIKGELQAYLNLWDFGNLCQLIELLEIENLNKSYRRSATHADLSKLVIRMKDGRVIEVQDYGNIAPTEYWAVGQVVERVLQDLQWGAR